MEKKLLPLAHKHAHRGGGSEPVWVRPWRWAKTAFFLAAMLASLLLVCAPPLLVVILDLALFSATLRANDTAYGGSFASAALAQARAFGFWSSLADLPAVSAARAALILCECPVSSRCFNSSSIRLNLNSTDQAVSLCCRHVRVVRGRRGVPVGGRGVRHGLCILRAGQGCHRATVPRCHDRRQVGRHHPTAVAGDHRRSSGHGAPDQLPRMPPLLVYRIDAEAVSTYSRIAIGPP
jgi:hypothetical protein